ncbi:ubiquitin-conjugating enzyme E2Q-like protein 1 [Bolinopsis microptera]|uniref:ubiquitin-conjugating enzyme E2Q-like protein 1 n=1 Tax=Bolinopsis microptera TaxID=2820187 RepID=UPI00307AE887
MNIMSKSKKAKTACPNSTTRNPMVNDVRERRLMKELQDITNNATTFTVDLVNDNLFEWHIKLHTVDKDSHLAEGMRANNIGYILLNMTFPDNFPFAPPFVRVVAPIVEGGYVLDGGALCLELLTPNGWTAAYTIEAIVTQVGSALIKGNAKIAKDGRKFSLKAAQASYKSLIKTHEKYGWVTPPKAEG